MRNEFNKFEPKEFIPYEEALALKKLGFLPCTKYDYPDFVEKIPAPLYQQAFRFFREEYGLVCGVREVFKGKYAFEITRWEDYSFSSIGVDSWENAEQSCLRKLIEIVKFHPLFVQAIQNQK